LSHSLLSAGYVTLVELALGEAHAVKWCFWLGLGARRNLNSLEIHSMKPSIALDAHRAEIRQIVEANRSVNARVFGSVLRGADTEGGDLDILVDPDPGMTLLNIGSIRRQLAQLLGVPVDVLTPNALPEKFREGVIAEAVPV